MNNIIPTPEQCLELREAGFPQDKTYFVYHKIYDINTQETNWIPIESSYPNTNPAVEDVLAAPTLGEIELQGDYRAVFNAYTRWHIADFRVNENAFSIAQNYSNGSMVFDSELEARIGFWIKINKPTIKEPSCQAIVVNQCAMNTAVRNENPRNNNQ